MVQFVVDQSQSFRRRGVMSACVTTAVLVLVAIASSSFVVEAFAPIASFVTKSPSRTRRNHFFQSNMNVMNNSRIFFRQQQQHSHAAFAAARGTRRTTQLHAAKSGGIMIQTESQYEEIVLGRDAKRPVLVFFSAPWCGKFFLCTCANRTENHDEFLQRN
jgi:hypothetical protein